MDNVTNSDAESQPYGVIYCLTNLINGKKYVGQTVQKLNDRLSQHKCGKILIVDKAIQKYGWENFLSKFLNNAQRVNNLTNAKFFGLPR